MSGRDLYSSWGMKALERANACGKMAGPSSCPSSGYCLLDTAYQHACLPKGSSYEPMFGNKPGQPHLVSFHLTQPRVPSRQSYYGHHSSSVALLSLHASRMWTLPRPSSDKGREQEDLCHPKQLFFFWSLRIRGMPLLSMLWLFCQAHCAILTSRINI